MDSEVLILLGLLVLVSAAYVRLWRRHRHDKGNLRLLFDAVENADYTLRFTERGKRNNSVNHWQLGEFFEISEWFDSSFPI